MSRASITRSGRALRVGEHCSWLRAGGSAASTTSAETAGAPAEVELYELPEQARAAISGIAASLISPVARIRPGRSGPRMEGACAVWQRDPRTQQLAHPATAGGA